MSSQLKHLTVPELKTIAKNQGVKNTSKMVRNELLQCIDEAEYLKDRPDPKLKFEHGFQLLPDDKKPEVVRFVPRYDANSSFFYGNTKPYKEVFKAAGCKFTISKDFGAGWTARRTSILEVMDYLDEHKVPFHF